MDTLSTAATSAFQLRAACTFSTRRVPFLRGRWLCVCAPLSICHRLRRAPRLCCYLLENTCSKCRRFFAHNNSSRQEELVSYNHCNCSRRPSALQQEIEGSTCSSDMRIHPDPFDEGEREPPHCFLSWIFVQKIRYRVFLVGSPGEG